MLNFGQRQEKRSRIRGGRIKSIGAGRTPFFAPDNYSSHGAGGAINFLSLGFSLGGLSSRAWNLSSAKEIDVLMFTLNDGVQQEQNKPWGTAPNPALSGRLAKNRKPPRVPKLIFLLAQRDRYACNPHPFGAHPSGSAPHAASDYTLDAL